MRSQGLNFKTPIDFLKKKKVQGITFTRSSVAYDAQFNQVPANVPRFNQGSLGQGLLIEEATTNLFPSAQSQSFDSPWTSGTLNGTYTVSINAGGSLTLSGGAIGTCNSGGTLTFTVTNATVTFTPTGAPTHSQLELKAYLTSWTLGGTTRAVETCTAPSNVLNIAQGTIECQLYVNQAIKDTSNTHFMVALSNSSYNKNKILVASSLVNGLLGRTSNAADVPTSITASTPSIGLHNLALTWNTSNLILYVNGVPVASQLNPYLPAALESFLGIGCSALGFQIDSFMKNIVFSKVARPAGEMAIRDSLNGPGFVVDKNVTFAMPNLSDLRAYYETKAV